MAETRRDQRTERPTHKRRREFRREGKVARSQDVGAALSLVGLVLVLWLGAPAMAGTFQEGTIRLFHDARYGFESDTIASVVPQLFVVTLVPILLATVAVGVGANLVQTGPVWAPKQVSPKLSRLSPKQGAQRFKPTTMLWEFVRVFLKAMLLVVVVWGPVRSFIAEVDEIRSLSAWLDLTGSAVASIILRAALLAVVIAVGDYAFNRRRLMQTMRMTKQEVRDELKATEGDPTLRGLRRQRARELNRNRMMSEIASADVVLVNPVRFAVALRYEDGEPAPRVVGKGVGESARKIRSEAYRNGVPVRQDIPLARALYRRTRVGQYVPSELYEAVAVVLAAVYRRRQLRRTAA